jgi:hypothetical protein
MIYWDILDEIVENRDGSISLGLKMALLMKIKYNETRDYRHGGKWA